ncbi:hypothetical protein MAR_014596, partial [Mya arenaria]
MECILPVGVVSFLGDFNANYDIEGLNLRDNVQLCNDYKCTSFEHVTALYRCYVFYQTLIDFICMPIEVIDMCTYCSGVFINEDLTQLNLQVLMCVKKKLPNIVQDAWAIGGKILFRNDTGRIQVVRYDNYAYWLDMPWPVVARTSRTGTFPKKKYIEHLKPYWNTELTAAHADMVERRRVWCYEGSPRSSEHFETILGIKFDSNRFWNIDNRKRKTTYKLGSGMNIYGSVVRDREHITTQWGLYFKNLYSQSENVEFDNQWKRTLSSMLDNSLREMKADPTVTVLPQDVETAILKCPKGKASSSDD